MIDSYSSDLDEKKRGIFYNLFIVSQKQKHTLKELYRLLDIDKTEYDRLKSEILLDFARSYRIKALRNKSKGFLTGRFYQQFQL